MLALIKKASAQKRPKSTKGELETYLRSLANDLQDSLGTKVMIQRKGTKGRIIIEFYSDDDLGRLIDQLR